MTPPPVRTNNRWIHVAPSPIQGKGLFARADIPTGTPVVEYDGPRVSASEGRKMAIEGNVFVFRLNRRECIDGSVKWNLARHANHSCAPNAVSENRGGRIWLCSLRPIAPGEEITYNYGFSFRDEPTPCHCGAPLCRGVIQKIK